MYKINNVGRTGTILAPIKIRYVYFQRQLYIDKNSQYQDGLRKRVTVFENIETITQIQTVTQKTKHNAYKMLPPKCNEH